MPKPSSLPRWATDIASLITDPPAGKKDVGWLENERPPVNYFNWYKNLVYQWCAYLDDIHNEVLTWAAAHTFQRGITVTQASTNANGTTTTGNGSGAGLRATGGSSNGAAIDATGGGTAPALLANAGTTGSTAILLGQGAVEWGGSEPIAGADPGPNKGWAASQAKAWASISTDGVGGASKADDYGVTSAVATATHILVTFARGFATANYAPTVTNGGTTPRHVSWNNRTTTTMRISFHETTLGTLVNPATTSVECSLLVHGRH